MDRLVDWMSSAGIAQMRPLFEKALAEGIDKVPDAPEPLREFFTGVETVPAWVNRDKLRKGQRALLRGGSDGMSIARDVSLLGGYQFSGFNKTLLRTGALEKGSNKRFAETMQWAMDVISDGGLDPLGAGYRSTLHVRLIHAFVRRHVVAMPDWRADEWGLPVNQTDMAATLVGALVAPPVASLAMGILPAPGELDAIAHLTRYVGWLIGVEDEWLPKTFQESIRVLYHTPPRWRFPMRRRGSCRFRWPRTRCRGTTAVSAACVAAWRGHSTCRSPARSSGPARCVSWGCPPTCRRGIRW